MKAKHQKSSPKHSQKPSQKRRILKMRLGIVCGLVLFCAAFTALIGCSARAEANSSEVSDTSSEINIDEMDLEYTNRDKDSSYNDSTSTHIVLSDSGVTVSGNGVASDGSEVTISEAGTYVITGSLSDGQLVVNASDEDKIQLVLAGASIHNEDGPAIYIKKADKTFITLADSTSNVLSDGTSYVLEENSDEPYATLFSKDDLTINGSGSLEVQGNYRHGVCSKDDLVITGGSISVKANEDALRGRDCVKISSGTFTLESGEDAIKSNNDEDGTKGFVSIDGGTFAIAAGDDAVHAESVLFINDGTIDVSTCYEGYEAEQIYINGATTHITASDDALNATARNSSAQTDAAVADGGTNPGDANPGSTNNAPADAGQTDPMSGASGNSGAAGVGSAVGVGGAAGSGGNAGANGAGDTAAAGGAGTAGTMGTMSEDNLQSEARNTMNEAPGQGNNASCLIQINGGYTVLDASGDGVDSNGSVEITGGVLLVSGPTSDGDGAFDYDNSATVSGGTVIMVGSSGMAQNFTSGTQPFAFTQVSGEAGELVSICKSDGEVIASFAPTKSYATVLVSSAGFSEGSEYSLMLGGSVSGANSDGYTTSGTVSGGSTTSITASTTPTGGMGGMSPDGAGLQAGQAGEPQRGTAPSGMANNATKRA